MNSELSGMEICWSVKNGYLRDNHRT
jgi:hypothetical protein